MSLKNLGKNSIIYATGKIAIRASAFVLIPFYTHSLSVSEYGLLSALLITGQILIAVNDFGINSALMRFYKEYSDDEKEGTLLGSALLINLLSGLLIIFLSILLLSPVFKFFLKVNDVFNYTILVSTASVSQALCVNIVSYFRARNQGFLFNIFSISVSILVLLLTIFLMVYLKLGIQGVFLAQILSYSLVWSIATKLISSKTPYRLEKLTIKKLLKYGFPLIFARSGSLIKGTIAVYMLSYFTNLEIVGIYSLAGRMSVMVAVVLIEPFQLAYEPYVFSRIDDPKLGKSISKITTYVIFGFTIIAISLIFVSRDLIRIIAPIEYYSAYYYMFLLLPIQAFKGISYISQSLLHLKNKTNITGSVFSIATILSIGLNYLFIEHYGIIGIIIVSYVYGLSIAIILFYFGIKGVPVKLERFRLTVLIIFYILSSICVYLMGNLPSLIYYPILSGALLVSLLSFYLFNFFDFEEKLVIKQSFNKIRFLFKHTNTKKI